MSQDSVVEGEAPVSRGQASTEDADEARRRWEGIHTDECYRDVQGVPSRAGKGDSRCFLYLGLALAIAIAVVAFGVYLWMRIVF